MKKGFTLIELLAVIIILAIEMSGTKPTTGTIRILNGEVVQESETDSTLFTINESIKKMKSDGTLAIDSGSTRKNLYFVIAGPKWAQLQFEEGMTWSEFVASPYNSTSSKNPSVTFSIDSNNKVVYSNESVRYYFVSSCSEQAE